MYSLGVVEGNVCGMLIQTENCGFSDPDLLEWSITPSTVPKPPVTEPVLPPVYQIICVIGEFLQNCFRLQQGSPTVKVLHLSDLHWDPDYLEGTNTQCGDPICCQLSSGPLVNATDAAGFWGDRRGCDLPWRTIENAMAHMALQHPVKLNCL